MKKPLYYLAATALVVFSCVKVSPSGGADEKQAGKVKREDNSTIAERAKATREKSGVELAPGLELSLWASDSIVGDPVALHVDDFGRVYYNRTNRQKSSEFDIRGHRNWIEQSISFKTPEDRRAFLRETFAIEKSKENTWLRDLNGDGNHDWRDLTVQREEVWRLEDTNGDGIADKALQVLNDFYEEITDVGHGVLVRAKDAFVTAAPNLWRLEDTNGDGVWDKKTSLVEGYGVHIGFSGHGMSNPIEGPDGKIYWNIGDIGSYVVKDGVVHDRSNEGTISRINPDGTGFEVFAGGLRNTHEFVFDEYGNLISSDNDGDHPGERERLVHVVDGMDAGWRTNWQFGKYTDVRNNNYKVWMDEKLSVPHWEGQAAYILPPIMNYHNGPTGMQYNPGTALGKKWRNKFFLVEFVGTSARSPIWAFGLKPKGASFILDGEEKILNGILPTGLRFGPDGALYMGDWVNGWGIKDYGRIWKLDVTDAENDLKAERAETKRLMQLDYSKQSETKLYDLLFYGDMRVRQKAQFELVKRGNKGNAEFIRAVNQRTNQLARVHAIWGIGQLTRSKSELGQTLLPLLNDSDAEIQAQAAKVIGDEKVQGASSLLIPLLKSSSDRVKFYAAQALGRLESKEAVSPLLEMVRTNADKDLYLRHTAVLALSRIGNQQALVAVSKDNNKSVRIAAVLALRRMKSDQVAVFLKDADEYIVTEAARAINDDHSIPTVLPALANVLKEKRFTSEPLIRRAINAASRVGGAEQLQLVVEYAKRSDIDVKLKAEALAALAVWANPSVLDRVDGRYRGKSQRDEQQIAQWLKPHVKDFYSETNPQVIVALGQIISEYKFMEAADKLAEFVTASTNPDIKIAALKSLKALNSPNLGGVVEKAMVDSNSEVRAVAISALSGSNLSKSALSNIASTVFTKGSIGEQQHLLRIVGTYPATKNQEILSGLVERLGKKDLDPGLTLELSDAVQSANVPTLTARLKYLQEQNGINYAELLYGGSRQDGRNYFFNNSSGECVRCHVIDGKGGEVGPNLSNIGNVLSREEIAQAMLEPSKRIAPGFGMVVLTLTDNTTVGGILMKEDADEVTLKTGEAEPLYIAKKRIKKRDAVPSSMPAMGDIMSKREVRDMVEFLSNLKKN